MSHQLLSILQYNYFFQTESSTNTDSARKKNLIEAEDDTVLPTMSSTSNGAADPVSSFDEINDLDISTTAVEVIIPTENSIPFTTQDFVNADFMYEIGSTVILDSNGPISEQINEKLMPPNNTSFDLDYDIIADTLNNAKDIIDDNVTSLGDFSSDSDSVIIENHEINTPQTNIGNNLQEDDVHF